MLFGAAGDALTGVNCFFVAAMLLIIAQNFQGKVGGKETAFFCICTTIVNIGTSVWYLFGPGDPNWLGAGAFLLFGFTYLFFALDILGGADTTSGLGWFAFTVMLACIPFSILYLRGVDTVMGIMWLLWAQLWGLFWVLNSLKKDIAKLVVKDTYVILTIQFLVVFFYLLGPIFFGYTIA